MEIIQHTELGSAAASITFSSIPQTYTDLQLVFSVRLSIDQDATELLFNSSTSGFTLRTLIGSGNSVFSSTRSDNLVQSTSNPSASDANTFSNVCLYIPNYRSAVAKSFSIDGVTERNDVPAAYQGIIAGLWNNTAAITSITLEGRLTGLWQIGSSATLYGITAGSNGIVAVS
jgi:hypothetical protein